jgi:hydroxymethylglutaryl-CoA synthase
LYGRLCKIWLRIDGEYTQGAGAVAMLISNQPDLIAFDNNWNWNGICFDFKPHQSTSDANILNALGTTKSEIEIFSDEPVFEGQYSNECYKIELEKLILILKKKC